MRAFTKTFGKKMKKINILLPLLITIAFIFNSSTIYSEPLSKEIEFDGFYVKTKQGKYMQMRDYDYSHGWSHYVFQDEIPSISVDDFEAIISQGGKNMQIKYLYKSRPVDYGIYDGSNNQHAGKPVVQLFSTKQGTRKKSIGNNQTFYKAKKKLDKGTYGVRAYDDKFYAFYLK